MDERKGEITIERRELMQIAQQIHQGYHQEHRGTWRECPMAVCARIRSVLGVADPEPNSKPKGGV